MLAIHIVRLNHATASCVVDVWLGCISVVPTTVARESATPDPKGKKQADADSRLFSKTISVRRVAVERVVVTVCCGAEQVTSTERHHKEPLLNVQYSIDDYICAAYVTTHAQGCIHRVCQYVCSPAT